MEKRNIVVVGRNWCNILTMTRALGEAGYDVSILRAYKKKPGRFSVLGRMKPDACSKYVISFQECVVNDRPDRLVEKLKQMAISGEKSLLIAVDDYTACIVDLNLQELSTYYFLPNVEEKEGQIVRLMDKNEQKCRALNCELPMLNSVLVKSKDGKFEIPETVSYPCFIKPNLSMNSTKAVMRKCEDKESLNKVLQSYAEKEDFEILVEEFAQIKNEYSLLGISTKEKTIAPCMFRVVEGGHKERKGVAISGEIISPDRYRKVIESCISYVKSLNYTGIFDIDLLETEDNKMYFIELNFRAGASTQAFTAVGVNLPGMFADYFLKNIIVPEVSVTEKVGNIFVSEKVLLEEFARSDVSTAKLKRYMKESDIFFIKDRADEKPYRYFKKYYLIAAMLRIPYKIRDFIR